MAAYTPDPGRARIIFKIDGKEFLNQEFAYHDEKDFIFESTHKWQPGGAPASPSNCSPRCRPAEEGNHHRPVRQQGDDRRSAREEPLGQDRKLRPLFPARRCRRWRQGTSCLCHGDAGRVRAEGVSPPCAARWRGHGERARGAGRSALPRTGQDRSNRAWRMPWRRCWRRRASCSGSKRRRRTR